MFTIEHEFDASVVTLVDEGAAREPCSLTDGHGRDARPAALDEEGERRVDQRAPGGGGALGLGLSRHGGNLA